MGPRLKLPPYVHAFTDRHGKPRFYFRRPGFRRAALPGLPYSSEFMAAYDAAQHGARVELGASRSKPGTVAAAVAGYLGSMAFAGLAEGTQRERRRILERFRAEHGEKGIATLGKIHVERMMSTKAPGAAVNFLVALRALMRHAILVGLRADDPTATTTRSQVPLRGLLHLDRGGYCGLRGQVSDWRPSAPCVRSSALYRAAQGRRDADGPTACPRWPDPRPSKQDR
jgi:hypothetical protein